MAGHCPQCKHGPYHCTGDSLRVEFQIIRGALDGSSGDTRIRPSAVQLHSGFLAHRVSGLSLGEKLSKQDSQVIHLV